MIFRVEIPIYRVGIVFIFGNDRKGAEKWLRKEKLWGKHFMDKESLDWCFNDSHDGITCSNDEGRRMYVHIGDKDNHRTIAHEIYHATMKLMEWIGMYPSPANEEAFAYVVGFITEEVYIKIQEHGKQ